MEKVRLVDVVLGSRVLYFVSTRGTALFLQQFMYDCLCWKSVCVFPECFLCVYVVSTTEDVNTH